MAIRIYVLVKSVVKTAKVASQIKNVKNVWMVFIWKTQNAFLAIINASLAVGKEFIIAYLNVNQPFTKMANYANIATKLAKIALVLKVINV